jgi:hypothetical protein
MEVVVGQSRTYQSNSNEQTNYRNQHPCIFHLPSPFTTGDWFSIRGEGPDHHREPRPLLVRSIGQLSTDQSLFKTISARASQSAMAMPRISDRIRAN